MNESNRLAAGVIIRNGAAGLAGFAASDLLESRPQWKDALATSAFTTWQGVLKNCAEELAASLVAGRPQFFIGHIAWLQSLLTSRGLPPQALESAITFLARVLEAELPAESGMRSAELCREALDSLERPLPAVPSFLTSDTPHGRLAASYLLALLEGDRLRAMRLILDAAGDSEGVPNLYLNVLLPVLREVGRMWQVDEINVAEEHFATATTKMVLAQLRLRTPLGKRNGKTLLAAAVSGNQHDIGLQVVADFFEMDGWRTIQLGSDMPMLDLSQAVEFYEPDLLALSVSLHTHLVTLSETIQMIRRGQRGSQVKILVGGRALAESGDLIQQFGADGCEDAPHAAVALGRQLVGL